jgi:hypothetical protein
MGPLMIGVPKRNDKYLKIPNMIFFVEIFFHLVTKKRASESNKGIFEIFLFNSPYFKEKS